jgi:surfactin synthase thioesterase subunit
MSRQELSNPCFAIVNPLAELRARLLCFPCAGAGTAGFYRWDRARLDNVELVAVRLPGREVRFREAPHRSIPAAVEEVATPLVDGLFGDAPISLFGHSLGAFIAFELARVLRRSAIPVRQLIVAASPAPHQPRRTPLLHRLDDEQLVRQLQERYDGIPAALAETDLLKSLLPVTRADIQMVETYEFHEEPPLECPIRALGGIDDRQVGLADLSRWRMHTSNSFTQRTFPGGHFFVQPPAPDVLRSILEGLV